MLLLLSHYIKKGNKVLDLGCGNGRLYPLVKQRGGRYLGVDSSQSMLKEAKKMYAGARFCKADALSISGREKFDLVFLIAVLHHIPSKDCREKAIRNVYNLLKPGGYALITNWNLFQRSFLKARWGQNVKKIVGQSKLDWNDIIVKQKRYYHGFSKREIARLLRKTGFQVVENYYELEGGKVGRWGGRNLVTVAGK